MNELIKINDTSLEVKEYNGQRVVTFKDVDMVHSRAEGTARKRFNDNKKHFVEYEDFYKVKCSEVRPFFGQTLPNGFNPNANITLLTESGYLMLVKSFTDDLAWTVQRQLVNSYFRVRQLQKTVDSYMIEDRIERAKRWIQEEEERKHLKETIDYQKPMADLAQLRIDKRGCYSMTDVTKTFGLKRGQITRWAKQKGLLHKTQNEVNKRGEKFFKVYSTDGIHNQIGITDDGLQYINNHIKEVKTTSFTQK